MPCDELNLIKFIRKNLNEEEEEELTRESRTYVNGTLLLLLPALCIYIFSSLYFGRLCLSNICILPFHFVGSYLQPSFYGSVASEKKEPSRF